MRLRNQNKFKQKVEQSITELLRIFFCQFKQFLQKFETVLGFELITLFYQIDPVEQPSNKIIAVWKSTKQQYEVWWEYWYDQSTKTLAMSTFVTQNDKIVQISGVFNINLAIALFERYTRQLDQQRHFVQFSINPLTGILKINRKAFIKTEQIKIELCKPQYIIQIYEQMKFMINLCQHIIQLKDYCIGKLSQHPYKCFLKNKKNYKKVAFTSQKFLRAIYITLNQISPNCQEDLQSFANQGSISQYIAKNQINFPEEIVKVVETLKGSVAEHLYHLPKIKVSALINQIYEASETNQTNVETQTLVRKIKLLGDHQQLQWKPFAMGGYGLLEKTYANYELSDLNGKNPQLCQGQIARKSDLKNNKIQREHRIFSLLKKQYHSNIMPHYIPQQKMYQSYIFSKYEPNMSLDKYMKKNARSISLETIVRFIQHLVKGLLFLKQKQIVHLDIKPNNILISKSLKAKITDFGQAYSHKEDPLSHRFGYTVPYVPSQVFYLEPFLNSKVDVYAVGVTIYKVLFGTHLWGEILDKDKFLEENYFKLNAIRLVPEKIYKFGLHQILGILINLSLKCVDTLQQKRPSLFYLSVLLSFCRNYITSLTKSKYQEQS